MKTILYFSAPWCGPCKTFGPIMDSVKEKGINVTKVDVDVEQELTNQYGIRNVPTIILVKDGVELDRKSGIQSEIQVTNWYNEF